MSNDAYGTVAKFYDTIIGSMIDSLRAFSLKLFPPTRGMKVLDVGCGTGSHLRLYQKADCEVYGIDMSPAMLQVATEKLSDAAELHLGDASQTPFADDQFDLVTTTLTLHEMPPAMRTAILNEMKRIIKPDGRIMLIDFHPGPFRFPQGWFIRTFILIVEFFAGREHFQNQQHFIKHGGLPTLIAEHGLSIKSQKIVNGGTMALFLLQK